MYALRVEVDAEVLWPRLVEFDDLRLEQHAVERYVELLDHFLEHRDYVRRPGQNHRV